MDQRIAKCRIKMRSRKWWYALFKWGIDATMSNAHCIHRSLCSTKDMDLSSFRRSSVTTWLQRYGLIFSSIKSMLQIIIFRYGFSPQPGRPLAAATLKKSNSDELRYDNIGHLIVVVEKERRCAVCQVNVKRSCFKCGVNLHDKCFFVYHVK